MSQRSHLHRPRGGSVRPRHAEDAAMRPQDLDGRKADRPWLRVVLHYLRRCLRGGWYCE